MKKIIYNKKLKKIFIVLLIFILLFNVIFPNMAMAAVSWYGNNAKGSIQEVADSMRTVSTNAANGSSQKTIADMIGSTQTTDKLKDAVINQIKSKFPNLEESFHERVYNYYRNNKELIEVTCTIGGNANMGYGIMGFTVTFGEELTQTKIEEDLEGKSDEEIGQVDTETQVDTSSDSAATGQDPSGGPTVEVDEDGADLGGILLSPLFYLINFIADAVISIVGSVMTGEMTDFGIGVLTVNPPNLGYTNSVPYTVDTSSFMPTNLVGLFSQEGSILYQYPNLKYTPEEIFAGEIELLSIDFISGTKTNGDAIQNTDWLNIRKVISQWYNILRMIAIIGLLSVLIYTGIKIIISANAKDKAKYKEWIGNWFMAVAILFSMHIIMAFIISVTGEFSKLLTEACQGINVTTTDGNSFVTNLMGLVRFMIQSENFYIKIGYEVMYIALIWYTIKFTFVYLKRVLNMAFLTLIAPIVALTYPIDKINDGRAQGFDMWLKEYIFNALLQPMHCVLYYVLVGSAVSIAASNPLYGIVVLAFMAEAEKLLKKIFGFDKASGGTVGGMASAFAAGAVASNLAKMAKLPKGNAGKGGAGGEDTSDLLKNLKAVDKDADKDDALFPIQEDEQPEPTGGPSAADAFQNSADPVADSTRERIDEKIAEGEDLTDEEKAFLEREQKNESSTEQNDNSTGGNGDSGTPIHQLNEEKEEQKKERSKFARGMGNVGKRLLKPVWDLDHKGKEGLKYNGERLLRKTGRAALGAGLGIGAAAVQAGISITDGKYNPAEGLASFAAGYAGGGQIASGFGSLLDTYKEGTLSDDPTTRNKERMERITKTWSQNDDVIKHNNNKYKESERNAVMDIQKELLKQGVTDLKEMDNCIKYIKGINNGSLEGYTSDMVRKSRVMHDFTGNSNVQKVMFDPKKRKEYINSVARDDKERRILESKFNEAINYDRIVNKK